MPSRALPPAPGARQPSPPSCAALAAAVIAALVAASACKPDGQREPRPERPGDAPGGPNEPGGAPGGGAAAAPDPDLPPPSTELGPVPDALAATFTLEPVVRGLRRPVAIAVAPGDEARRLFVAEQHVGRVRVIEEGQLSDRPFLDLRGKVSTGNEQGLLGLAFHPRFAENRKVYISYTDPDGDSRVEEYQVPTVTARAVDPATRREVFHLKQPYSNHNGGHLLFGPDGKLYLGIGDGGGAGDPKKAGQDRKQLLAKMLRIDVDTPGAKPEMVAIGVRNPWRFEFDPRTGDVYIADVGQNEWEWVHVVEAGTLDGRNFGWNVIEGSACFGARSCDRSKFTLPVVEYSHEEGCSVTGGVVYRGQAHPELDGVYFYADYCLGWIRSFRWRPDGVRQHWNWRPVLDPDGQLSQLSTFGRDADGELYLASLNGTVWRLARR